MNLRFPAAGRPRRSLFLLLSAGLSFLPAVVRSSTAVVPPRERISIGSTALVERSDGVFYQGIVTAVTDEALALDIGGKVVSVSWSEVKNIRETRAATTPTPELLATPPSAGSEVLYVPAINATQALAKTSADDPDQDVRSAARSALNSIKGAK